MPEINFDTFLRQKDSLAWQQMITWVRGTGSIRHLIWKGFMVRDNKVIDIPSYFAYISVDDSINKVAISLSANVKFDPMGRGQKTIDKFVVGNKNEISDEFLMEVMRQRYEINEVDFTKTPVGQQIGAGDWLSTQIVSQAILRKKMMINLSDKLLASIFFKKNNLCKK